MIPVLSESFSTGKFFKFENNTKESSLDLTFSRAK